MIQDEVFSICGSSIIQVQLSISFSSKLQEFDKFSS